MTPQQAVALIARRPAACRLVRAILAGTGGVDGRLHVTQRQLAADTGVAPNTVWRVMPLLEVAGCVTRGARVVGQATALQIDGDRLRALAEVLP